jgi:hypothetical protein
VLVIIEGLTNFLSDNLTIDHLTPNEYLMPYQQIYSV